MGLALFGAVDRAEDLEAAPRLVEAEAASEAEGELHAPDLPLAIDLLQVPAVGEEELAEARDRSTRSGLELVDLSQIEIDRSAASALPATIARRHRAAAIGRRFGLPLIAVASPENLLALDDIYLAAGCDVLLVVAPARQVDACIEALYPREPEPVAAPPTEDRANGGIEGHYGVEDVDWYRIGETRLASWSTAPSDGVRADPVLPRIEPFEEPPLTWAAPAADADEAPAADADEAPTDEESTDGESTDGAPLDEAEAAAEAVTVGEPGTAQDEDLGDEAAAFTAEVVAAEAEGAGGEAIADEGGIGEAESTIDDAEAAGIDEAEADLDRVATAGLEAVSRVGEDEVAYGPPVPDEAPFAPVSWAPEEAPLAPGETAPTAIVAEAVAEAPRWSRRDVGEILRSRGLVSDEQLATARQNSQTTGRPLRTVLAELHLAGETELLEAVAEEAGRDVVDLDHWPIDPRAGSLIPEAVARRYGVLAIGFEDGRPVVATADPSDVLALDDVRTLLGGDVVTVVCAAQQIEIYLGRVYRRSEETDLAARDAALVVRGPETARVADVNDTNATNDEAPVVKFVNLVLRQALNEKASDVHIEPTAQDLVVRCRIDGVLQHMTSAPKAIQGSVTTRLKVMAGLDIAEHRVPQDGRFSLGAGNRQVDLRLATLPTVHGEKIVLRILDKSTAPLDLNRLGFLPGVLERYERAYRKPAGTILVTGPTGSGKSTTLYATLSQLNSPERNLITVEDPVEYQLAGVNQVQVNPKAGLTFANALRSILRSDPDVILVGEIRDRETATIAVEAALTGHLVLSCLHTNDAAGTPMRLIEMGVEPFLVGSAIDCVLAQRLARVLCQRCAQPYTPNAEELRSAGWDDGVLDGGEAPAFRRANGCQACSGTGYRGRIAVQEVLLVDEQIERAILDRVPSEEIARLAAAQGMRKLRVDGLHKAALGITSLEEIMRVVA